MKFSKTILALAVVSASWGAHADNLLSNGSFENGLTGWSVTGAGSNPLSVKSYGPNFYGETVLADNSTSLSPDAAGTHGVYFVDDIAKQTLTQSVTLTSSGMYSMGFSTYAPANGLNNSHNASFSAAIGSNTLFSTNISSLTGRTWQAQSGAVALAAGTYNISFTFTPTGYPAKDIVIDRVYLLAAPVPEPETYAMLLAGLGLMGVVRRRKNKAA